MYHLNEEYVLVQSINNLIQYINGTFVPSKDSANDGLCDSVLHCDLDVIVLITHWEENATENSLFPVEGTFKSYRTNRKKHDRRTTYGKKRLRLAKYLLINLQTELEKY